MGNKGLIAFIVIVLAVLSLPLLTTGNKILTPEQVVAKFEEAKSSEEVKPYVTAKAWEVSSEDGFLSDAYFSSDDDSEITVYQGTINGSEANVPAQVSRDGESQNVNVLLRQEEGKWLVYAASMSIQGMELSMNFENPDQFFNDIMEEAMEMLPEEMRSIMTPEMKQGMMKEMKKAIIEEMKK